MWRLIRLQLALLPFLWSMYQENGAGDDDSDDGDATGTNGDTSGDASKGYTKDQFRRALAAQAKKQREEIEAQVRAESESKRLEEDKKWEELATKRAAEVTDVKRQLEARAAQERDRILRYEIRDAARDLSFIDPDDAYHLIDRTQIEFNDEDAPKGVAALLKALAEKKPHLIKSAQTGVRGIPATPNGEVPGKLTRDDIKNQYLQQAGVRQP